MPPKKFTRPPLRVADIHESDENLQPAASTAERTTPMCLPGAVIDDDDNLNDDLDDDLGDHRDEDSPISNDIGVLCPQITERRSSGCGNSTPVDAGNTAATSSPVERRTETRLGEDDC